MLLLLVKVLPTTTFFPPPGKDYSIPILEDEPEPMIESILSDDSPRRPSVNLQGTPQTKYITILPGFGPNNQYLGLKDVLYITRKIGRIFARPSFFLHWIDGPESLRSFESTFDAEELNKHLPTISLPEFSRVCEGKVVLVWTRPVEGWRPVVKYWMTATNMTSFLELSVEKDTFLHSDERILEFLTPVQDSKCIAILFPFRTVSENEERKEIATWITHAPSIRNASAIAKAEMGITPTSKFLAIHYRWGEDTCGKWLSPEPHLDYDFCWGTAVFRFAKLSDVLETMSNFLKKEEITHVYLAFSHIYHDKVVLQGLKDTITMLGVRLIISTDVPTLNALKDNYYLSLVEQEICSTADYFLASSFSTWSDFVRDYHSEKVKQNPEWKAPVITTFEDLLKAQEKHFTQWNRVHDKPTLDMRLRPRNRK